jgi:hypothetical protein
VLGDYLVDQSGRMNERLSDSNIVRSQHLASSSASGNDWMDTSTRKFHDQRQKHISKQKKKRKLAQM